uniref:Uncharacterized protein n=1 Tax=Quercus lobata TaxID=97700 RepID=A0A7N2MZR6_QUELO
MQFKVLGERLKTSNGNTRIASEGRTISNGSSRRQSLGGAENFSKSSSNGMVRRRRVSLTFEMSSLGGDNRHQDSE